MPAYLKRNLLALSLAVAGANAAIAAPPAEADVRLAMVQVERLLQTLGVDVSGYAASAPPQTELAPAHHPFLQGRDGGYAGGRIYLNEDAIEACRDLTLVHELVHDATVKRRLFAGVPNGKVRGLIEALADAVTAQAAEEPYRPGCLPARHFAVSTVDLAALAISPPAP